mmetsp:Transcript_54491/g.145892  ORF Transcript_54491/g.145892 Transcript_54491/m.145892 type:complete len:245 (-) Transcript_54491:131-865(-)
MEDQQPWPPVVDGQIGTDSTTINVHGLLERDEGSGPTTIWQHSAPSSALQSCELETPSRRVALSSLSSKDDLLEPGAPPGDPREQDASDSDNLEDDGPNKGARPGLAKARKKRPCKEKRLRYKEAVASYMEQISRDPYSFNIETLELPKYISSEARLQAKLKRRLQDQMDTCRRAAASGLPAASAPDHTAASSTARDAPGAVAAHSTGGSSSSHAPPQRGAGIPGEQRRGTLRDGDWEMYVLSV